jgi:apolipoprotein N-acyltransferase
VAVAVAALTTLGGLYGYGAARLAEAPAQAARATRVRIVQANIDQKEKWKPENLEGLFATYEALTRSPGAEAVDVVIWPEGALPAVIDDLVAPGSPFTPRLAAMLVEGQTLMMGANRAGVSPGGSLDYYNSLVAFRRIGGGLQVTGIYDKHKLVPFGEFMPLGELATAIGFRSLVHMPEDFTAGPPPRSLAPEGLPRVQPLICYEALFPELARNAQTKGAERPAWYLNVSNDAWFGPTSGPWQHLNIASYRAIEEGIPMVRSTPTGVSAVIDAYGRTIPGARLGQGQTGVIDAALPQPIGKTTYSRLGDLIFAFMLLLSGASPAVARIFRQ